LFSIAKAINQVSPLFLPWIILRIISIPRTKFHLFFFASLSDKNPKDFERKEEEPSFTYFFFASLSDKNPKFNKRI
jgi:hypothetical protein